MSGNIDIIHYRDDGLTEHVSMPNELQASILLQDKVHFRLASEVAAEQSPDTVDVGGVLYTREPVPPPDVSHGAVPPIPVPPTEN